jgi:transcription elongation factor GreA
MKQATLAKVTYITPKGLSRLQNELEYLKTVKRSEIASYLQETSGDVEEPEYLFAQEEQSFVEGRIQELERLLANVQVIEPGEGSGFVEIGSTVVIKFDNTEAETYTIVGSAEADPALGLISNESPIGSALLGCQVGDEKGVNTPSGLMVYQVIAIQ